uniref:Rab-GAP TBC domain-containing protein n=1 Tax=Spongospora subterranea TaxID=70186 RepID=A0A0H5RBE8_9EUKA|eukprot:CRZ10947.1 hypothetical protein [Spongospora subterranea]
MPWNKSDAISPLEACLRRFLASCSSGEDDDNSAEMLFQLRRHLLLYEIAEDEILLRGLVWKTLLGVSQVNADKYCDLIRKGPCDQYQKIRSDSFRTFPCDKSFQSRVSENSLIRLLNSFVHENADEGVFRYLQGMNAVSAPFLFCMGELNAHAAFSRFITVYCPTYWERGMSGARAGCILVDRCLEAIDPDLFNHLKSCKLVAMVYAFPLVSSLSCCLQPFSEVLKLWDFLIAFGLHFNIMIIVAQVILVRSSLFAVANPNEILNYRKWPPLNARLTIAFTLDLINRINSKLSEAIESHTYSKDMCERITSELQNGSP